jgi:outer membrane immunogenic protein
LVFPRRIRELRYSGFIGGAQWPYQLGNVVSESDISWAGRSGNTASSAVTFGGLTNFTASQKLDWFGTSRARLGFTSGDRWMLYGTAGLAYGGVTLDSRLDFVGANFYSGSRSKVHVGWTAGLGAEYAMGGNWSAKLEYLYYDLRSGIVVASSTPPNRRLKPIRPWVSQPHRPRSQTIATTRPVGCGTGHTPRRR